MNDEIPIRYEYELLHDMLALDLKVVESKRNDFLGTVHMKMVLREDPDLLASCSFALIYGLAVSGWSCWARRMRRAVRVVAAFAALATSLTPKTTMANGDRAEWCEHQWRIESGAAERGNQRDLGELLKRWEGYAGKCSGTVVYEVRLAVAHALLGDVPKAREMLERLKGVRSARAYLVLYGLAMCDFIELGRRGAGPARDFRRVEKEFLRVVRERPDFAEGYAPLGAVQTILGDCQGAIKTLEAALKAPMNLSGVYRNLAVCYAAVGRYRDALGAGDEAYTGDRNYSSDPYFMYAMARANAGVGQFEEAEVALKLLLTKSPDLRGDPEFKNTVAFLKARREATEQAGPRSR